MFSPLETNFEHCCRLCAQEHEATINIFSDDSETLLLLNKLNKYLLIEIEENDYLPKIICIDCCTKLKTLFDFIETARKTQTLLLKRSIMYDNMKSKNMPESNVKIEENNYEGSSEDDAKDTMEINVDPMMVLQNCEDSQCSLVDSEEVIVEDVTHLHAVDESVTITLLKKVDKPDIKPFPCLICKRSFLTELALKNHSWIHSSDAKDDSQYHCYHCDIKFDYKMDLLKHIKEHRKNGMCRLCGRIFRTAENLAAHNRTVHMLGYASHTCKICGRSYANKSNLKTHSVTHSSDRPYACHVCMKTFKRAQDLKFHINQHTGAKPYKCPFCDKSFASSGNCYSHRSRMHPGRVLEKTARKREKNPRPPAVQQDTVTPRNFTTSAKILVKHKCHICDHTFTRKDNFAYHMFGHTGQKQFKCSFCLESYVTRRGLMRHHDKAHPGKNRPLALISKNMLLK